MQDLLKRLKSFGSPRIALLGDFMLDRWVYGNTERLSQEAPVPILSEVRRETLTGGAGNIAGAIVALGGEVVCIGVIGDDGAGGELASLLTGVGCDGSQLIPLGDRPTTVKTRYIGLAQHRIAQQMFRVDAEVTAPVSDAVAAKLSAAVQSELKHCKVLALEDYNKGVLNDSHTPELIAAARGAGCIVVVDPALIDNYQRYRGATLLTPNRYEAAVAAGIEITDDASLEQAARRILKIADADAVVITLDKEGAYLMCRDGRGQRIPHPHPRAVYDVSGAGDEVLSALAVALAEGCSYEEATALANIAGGLEVERFGVVPIARREVVDELRAIIGLRGSKLVSRTQLEQELRGRRRLGETIVFTNGCFDLLHMGHLRCLREARELGSCLVVAINSDAGIKRLKGPHRPVIGQDERAEMLAALECVDYVTIFDEDTPETLLELLRPDILAKGGTTPDIVGRGIVEGYGGRVCRLSLVAGTSTTDIIQRILDSHDNPRQADSDE